MSSRPIYLFVYRGRARERAHFAIFVPNSAHAATVPLEGPCTGTIIHVTGMPMAGYMHEFKRNYSTATTQTLRKVVRIGSVTQEQLPDSQGSTLVKEDTPRGILDGMALQVAAPRKSENFMAPVNDTTNRRCQEWTMDYIRYLVARGQLEADAVDLAQAERDPPEHGIMLNRQA